MRAPRGIFALALVVAAVAARGVRGGATRARGSRCQRPPRLQAQLDGTQARLDQGSVGACKDILEGPRGPNKQQVQDLIDSMPDDVDSDVESALQDSFDHLWDLVSRSATTRPPASRPTPRRPRRRRSKRRPRKPDGDDADRDPDRDDTHLARRGPAAERRERRTATANGNGNGNGNGGGVGGGGRADEPAHGGRRPLRARAPPGRRRDVHRVRGARHGARAARRCEAPGRAPRRRRGVRVPVPPRGAVGGAAPAPEHRAGVRLGAGPEHAPPLHRHGVRGRAVGRGHAARAQAARASTRRSGSCATPATGSTTRTAPASCTAT